MQSVCVCVCEREKERERRGNDECVFEGNIVRLREDVDSRQAVTTSLKQANVRVLFIHPILICCRPSKQHQVFGKIMGN